MPDWGFAPPERGIDDAYGRRHHSTQNPACQRVTSHVKGSHQMALITSDSPSCFRNDPSPNPRQSFDLSNR